MSFTERVFLPSRCAAEVPRVLRNGSRMGNGLPERRDLSPRDAVPTPRKANEVSAAPLEAPRTSCAAASARPEDLCLACAVCDRRRTLFLFRAFLRALLCRYACPGPTPRTTPRPARPDAGPRCSVQCCVRHASPRGPRIFRTTRFCSHERRRPPSPRVTNFPTQPRSSAPRPPAPDERQAEARFHFSFPPPKLRTAPSGLFRLPPENTTTKRPPDPTVQKTPGAFSVFSASPTPKHRPHICIRRAKLCKTRLPAGKIAAACTARQRARPSSDACSGLNVN